MKVVTLCREGPCCSQVKVPASQVEIGEADNTCVLTIEQREILRALLMVCDLARGLWPPTNKELTAEYEWNVTFAKVNIAENPDPLQRVSCTT